MQKFYPQQKVWFWDRVTLLLFATLVLIYFSVDAVNAYLAGRIFSQNVFILLAPVGAFLGLAIIFYFLYQYFLNRNRKTGLVLDKKGILIPMEKPLLIPWDDLLKVDKRDFKGDSPVAIPRKDYIYILYNNSKKSAVWLPPSVYGLSAKDLQNEINTFWQASKSFS